MLSDFLSHRHVVCLITGSNAISRQGSTRIINTILTSAPREIRRQMLFSSSILLIAATPTVAAKNVKPLDKML